MMIMTRQPALLVYLCLLVYCVWCEPSSQQQGLFQTQISHDRSVFSMFGGIDLMYYLYMYYLMFGE